MDSDDIIDLFAAFGRVSVRRMFGGFGIYADGTMFALAARGVIHLKADDETAPAFERESMGPFTYTAKGRGRTSLSYWRLPDRLHDDPDELADWARTALTVARRAKAPKAAKGRSKAKQGYTRHPEARALGPRPSAGPRTGSASLKGRRS